jgi:hypothetical protein
MGSATQDVLVQYATFEKLDPKLIQTIWYENPIKLYNLTMMQGCLGNNGDPVDKFLPKNSLYLYYAADCHYITTPSAKILDRGEPSRTLWNIYEN